MHGKVCIVNPRVCTRLLLLVFAVGGIFPLRAGPLTRVPNTSLHMPPQPPVYGFGLAPITNAAGASVLFNLPVGFATPPGETNRLFVIEKAGSIAVITNLASPNRTVFLSLTNKVVSQTGTSEGGLLGLAFHPGYVSNGYFYVYYLGNDITVSNGMHDILSRFSVDAANANHASTNTEVKLIRQFDGISSHNAGDIHFGPDGYLYYSLGDEGAAGNTNGDPRMNAQFIDKNFFSAIARLDVDKRPGNLPPNSHPSATTNYLVPVENPFVGATNFNGRTVNSNNVRTEFYAVGFRNPWRFTFDPVTGRLLVGDVGLKDREEIDDVVKGGNYGWSYREGTTNGSRHLEAPSGFASIAPIFEYGHVATNTLNWPPQFSTNLGGTVIGGVFYHGDRLSQLKGFYVFGDYDYGIIEPAGQPIWAFKYDGTNISNFQRLLSSKQIAAYGIDPANGDVLLACLTNVATFGPNAGFNPIYRLVYDTNNVIAGTPLPPTLADTGAFADLTSLTPPPGIAPYSLNVPFWSDNATKTRWFSLPDTNLTFGFDPDSNWSFPTGAIWIKHFELELTNGVAASRKRLETRLIVKIDSGVYGVTYRWGNSLTNANLVPEEGLNEPFVINDGGGILRTQVWHYPSRLECLACHTPGGGGALGMNTPQFNHDQDFNGTVTNLIQAMSDAGYFTAAVTNIHLLRALAPPTNSAVSLEYRVRSYLAANCVQCHQPGGAGAQQANWDARITTQLPGMGVINGPLVDNIGDASNRVIVPGDPAHSVMLYRIATLGGDHMPPLATSVINTQAVALLSAWITNDLAGYQSFSDWQIAKFGSTNSPAAGAAADPDGDGAVNYLEYLTATEPLAGTNFWNIAAQWDGTNVGVSFRQIANRGFEVQFADPQTHPVSWQPLDIPANTPFFGATTFTNIIVDQSPLANDGRYYRVRVFEP